MGRKTRIYYATDVHGASLCFRKFLNAGNFYSADVLILGGDVAGKAIQAITREADGKWHCTFIGTSYVVDEGPELTELERLIEDHGYYPYRAESTEMAARQAEGSMDALFLELMTRRLERWLDLADERLRPIGKPLYFMLGNDDPVELKAILDRAPWGIHAEGKVLPIDDEHEMMSWGYSNITPWHSYREQSEAQLRQSLERMRAQLQVPRRAIVNVHVPPYGTQLDDAPLLDESLRVQQTLGQVKFAPAGSEAVRDFLLEVQPLLGLHGHIHESTGIRRLGRTIAINPGSDYSTGALNGALVTLEGDRVLSHQLVRG
jgi:Icc-related predicted phosphoesterase